MPDPIYQIQDLVREGTLPLQEAIRITCEIATALDHAHRRGVVHRDVKPENIDFSVRSLSGSAWPVSAIPRLPRTMATSGDAEVADKA